MTTRILQTTQKLSHRIIWGAIALSLFACTGTTPTQSSRSLPPPATRIAFSTPIPRQATNTPRPTFTPTAFSLPAPVPRNTAATGIPPTARNTAPPLTPTAAAQIPTNTPFPTPQSLTSISATDTPPPTAIIVTPTTIAPNPETPPTPTPPPPTPPPPTATPIPATGALKIANIRQVPNEDGTLMVLGELVNETPSGQTLFFITGTFSNAAGQTVAEGDDISDYWLTDMIPPQGRLPFELTVDSNGQAIADFALDVYTEPAPTAPGTDFSVTNVQIQRESESYCVDGTVQVNPPPVNALQIIITGYTADNTVTGFDGEAFSLSPDETAVEFSFCLDDADSLIDHYTLQTWGN